MKVSLRLMLDSRFAMWLGWGADFTFFYNDAYAAMTLGPKHPWALGRAAREVWSEIWTEIGPRANSVLRTGQATWDEGLLLFLERRGFREESYHTFSYSPIPDDRGDIGGMLCVVKEDTEQIIGERRLRTLRELAARTTDGARSAAEACQRAVQTLAEFRSDLPFVLLYLIDGDTARLAGLTGLLPGSTAAPREVALGEKSGTPVGWPLREVWKTRRACGVSDLAQHFGPLPAAIWPEPADQAVVLPMAQPGQAHPAGFVIAGISPRLALDDEYRGFLELLTGQIAATVQTARAFEQERARAEALAELDRAKTTFFSNVSHEFRTPLTLMLGPAEDALAETDDPRTRQHLEVLHRNTLRLLKLVNTLLDFSRTEAGRVQARYVPTDLATFTAELASGFRSACEKAGLRFSVECEPLPEPYYIDREMWEKVILNLLSNAFKFTLNGAIALNMRAVANAAQLRIRDTGVGITEEQLPHIFERFHRVEGTRARTHEGTGIGLALVQELVKLHGGTIEVESEFGRGTTFIVSIPRGKEHLPPERVETSPPPAAPSSLVGSYVEEALRWLPGEEHALPESAVAGPRPYVLLADDNADMREYIRRLLAPHYELKTVEDGEAALAAIALRRPDLVITDVMMPRLDGFGLLKALRSEPATGSIPILMLSARAGEEATVEGIQSGADDYLVKPFAARELLARVGGALALAKLRREAILREEELKAETTGVLESINEGFLAVDRDWRFTYVNAAAERLNGMRREEILGRTHWEVFPRTVGTRIEREYRRVMVDRVPNQFQNYYEPWDRWFEMGVYPVKGGGIAIYYRDITELKKAEERDRRAAAEALAAAEANAKFRTFFEQGTQFAAIATLDGTVVEVNRVCLDACGYHREEVIGQKFWECGWWNRAAAVVERVQAGARHAATGNPVRLETPYFLADGTERILDLAISPVTDSAGQALFIAPTGTDITERKRAEEALQEADRRKNEFLATLAHELRNPLAPVRNALSVLRLAPAASPMAGKARDMMERQIGHMVRLIDDLMDVSRVSQGKVVLKLERVELRSIVEVALETSRPLIDAAHLEFSLFLPHQPIWIDADPTRLSQVITNLLNNAAKYTPEGGRIALFAEATGGQLAIRIADTGVGIPRAMLPKVFDLFTQVGRTIDRAQGGLGIGLSLVKKLVEMHGGTVEADSPGPGRGSTFTVRLAIAPDSAPATAAPTSAGESSGVAGRRVLIVDDNVDAAESLGLLVEMAGHTIRVAHDGPAALEAARHFAPEVIFLDIGMPGMNGYEVARRLHADAGFGSTVLVALTGWASDDDKRSAREAGFDFHLTKPVETTAVDRLLATLNSGARL